MTDGAHPLDNPFWHALTGPQAQFGERRGRAARYAPDVSPMGALEGDGGEVVGAWADLEAFTAPGETVALFAPGLLEGPPGWTRPFAGDTLQMVQARPTEALPAPDGLTPRPLTLRPLTLDDAPAALELVALTRPGPFAARTLALGHYLGLWDGPLLVALSGQRARLEVNGQRWCEVSAVCTHPEYRRRGLARVLVSRVAAHTRAEGFTPFLHVNRDNAAAIGTYEGLGFVTRRPMRVNVMRCGGV